MSSSFQRDTPTINLGGGILLDRDFSGSMDFDELSAAALMTLTNFDDIGPRGTGMRDFIFYEPDQTFIGPRQPYLLFSDEVAGADYRKALDNIMGNGFSHAGWSNRPDLQFFFDEAYHMADSYEQCHNMPYKDLQWQAPAHKPGETPRGTKPSYIGGQKKTKQQRWALKARRKQR